MMFSSFVKKMFMSPSPNKQQKTIWCDKALHKVRKTQDSFGELFQSSFFQFGKVCAEHFVETKTISNSQSLSVFWGVINLLQT